MVRDCLEETLLSTPFRAEDVFTATTGEIAVGVDVVDADDEPALNLLNPGAPSPMKPKKLSLSILYFIQPFSRNTQASILIHCVIITYYSIIIF